MQAFLPVPGGELYYERTGSGPPVVFAHAGIADLTMWEPQVEPLAGSHTVVRFDARGYGRSRTEPVEFRPEEDLLAVLDHLELDRAVLVGCSRGGQHCLDLTVAAPEHTGGLVWVCGGVSGLEHDAPPAAQSEIFERIEQLWEAKEWEALVDLETHVWVDGPLEPDGRAPAAVREHVRRMIHAIETRGEPEPIPLEPRLPAAGNLDRVRCPTLVVIGALDTSGTRASADCLSAGIAGAERVDFPDAAHVPSLEHPERFNEALFGFLARNGL